MRLRETAVLSLSLACAACAAMNWERNLYDGMRQGNDQAARRGGPAAVPQTTPLPAYDAYESERRRLRGEAPARPEAAASQPMW